MEWMSNVIDFGTCVANENVFMEWVYKWGCFINEMIFHMFDLILSI